MATAQGSSAPKLIRLFLSYSHRDEALREELIAHLTPLMRQGVVQGWHDRKMGVGHEWKDSIDENLEGSDIIVFLISADFLASDYCYSREVRRTLEKQAAGEALVIPVIVRPVDWRGAPFSHLQALPSDGKAVTSWPNRDEAWANVVMALRKIIEKLKKQAEVQRAKAQKILIPMVIQELEWIDSMEEMATAGNALQFSPIGTEPLPHGFVDARSRVDTIAQLTRDYLTRATAIGQLKILQELHDELQALSNAMASVRPPVGPSLQRLAHRWLYLVKQEQANCQQQLSFTPLPNPFVVGNPLQPRDHDLFKGRKDIIVALEEHIINTGQRPTLLLYGRRRIGKTSTLLNLPRLLSSQFVPVFIDLQDAKWRESDGVFCYQLVRTLIHALRAQASGLDLKEPKLEQFEKYPFSALDEALDHIEGLSQQLKKRILLTFDEYERLGEGLKTGKLTTEILNQLRNVVQHRECIVVLFSGSHRFEELRAINWSDYLINVKTLELSFLPAEDARKLLTQPVPELDYQPGVIDKILALTHCQPFLLQAVAFELVNILNNQNRLEAKVDDIEVAVEKVLTAAQAYFFYTWQEECSEEEKAVLRALAANGATSLNLPQDQKAVRSMCQKDILENVDQQYHFTIELFRRWIVKNQDLSESSQSGLQEPIPPARVAS